MSAASNGHFDGQYYTISGIRIYKSGTNNDNNYQGLFGHIGSSGEVKNVVLTDAHITGYFYIGGIAGCNKGTVSHCHVTSSVNIHALNQASSYHGGIAGANEGTNSSSAIVSFNEGSELGKFYFGTQNANIYLPQGGKDYAIAFSDKQGEVPVHFKAKENGTYTISVNPEDVEMEYLHLIDNLTGNDIDLLRTPYYTFEGRTTDYANRFKLVFGAGESAGEAACEPFAFISDGEIILLGEGMVQVIDMTGRIITSVETSYYGVSTNGMAPGVYVLRLINGDDVKTQKIVVK